MKTKKPELLKMQLLLLMLFIFSSIQAQRWRLGGNSNLPAADDITAPGANQFGSQAGFNIPINFITKKGRGQLNVFASDLSSGMYTYSLVVDGKTIDTKKMVKSE